ncbi:SDR family oxidoreductase [Stutzerimonas stutzeri]|uniref:SDR family oxidoreductase n=1 Tax=Stutzerimonas stutzeri TaxID=316 RepID=UPI002108C452|nr:SDR family oxidoreductase [Stutzerimonas stutzeri]MCQ4318794.1 SDR family oxidoreductase [Stutzerimonas stutzeri]
MQLENLQGKVAVITGASSGIGEAAARLLVDEGVNVVMSARRLEKISVLAEELGPLASAVQLDVTDALQVNDLFESVRAKHGGLDLLFNNAGLGIYASFVESRSEDWLTQINTNIVGLLHCTHAAIPLMKNRPGAMISSVSSVGGRHGVAGWSVYSATKFAVIGFHDALRKELGPDGIRVSVIEPGAVWTEFGHNIDLSERRQSLDALESVDVAQALVYAFAQPPRVLVQEILIRPVRQIAP